jgi:imidazole glycerol-phosphate synthase subunit HisH
LFYQVLALLLTAGLVPGMVDALHSVVIDKSRPFLGICVGMQLLATRGLEFGATAGLDWIKGDVSPIVPADPALKIPHIGWNTLRTQLTRTQSATQAHPLLTGIVTGEHGLHAYFVHSFHLTCRDPADLVAIVDYGCDVTAMVARHNIVGTQFHPEKSQALGLRLIANFLRWQP